MEENKGFAVYTAILAVQEDLSRTGIAKEKKNTDQNYKFRGIDDIFDALAPILAKHKLCIIPKVLSRAEAERTTSTGKKMFQVLVEMEYTFVSCVDGSKHVTKIYGESQDTGDKATNKSMSAAYKYLTMQTFCIPVEVADADANTSQETASTSAAAKLANGGQKVPPWENTNLKPVTTAAVKQPDAQIANQDTQGKSEQQIVQATCSALAENKTAQTTEPQTGKNTPVGEPAKKEQKSAILRLAQKKGQTINPVSLEDLSFTSAADMIMTLNKLKEAA